MDKHQVYFVEQDKFERIIQQEISQGKITPYPNETIGGIRKDPKVTLQVMIGATDAFQNFLNS